MRLDVLKIVTSTLSLVSSANLFKKCRNGILFKISDREITITHGK